MTKLKRDLSSAKNREFWSGVDRAAEEARHIGKSYAALKAAADQLAEAGHALHQLDADYCACEASEAYSCVSCQWTTALAAYREVAGE